MTLSKFIKDKRNASKLTQPELADKAGVGLRLSAILNSVNKP